MELVNQITEGTPVVPVIVPKEELIEKVDEATLSEVEEIDDTALVVEEPIVASPAPNVTAPVTEEKGEAPKPRPFITRRTAVSDMNLNQGKKVKKPVYDVTFMAATFRISRFDAIPETIEAYRLITKYGISINHRTDIGSNELCLPIKITPRNPHAELQVGEDWTKYGSCITELDYRNVIRWWPASAFKQSVKMGQDETVRIEYPTFILNGLVRYAYAREEQAFFKDIKLPKDRPAEVELNVKSFMNPGREHEDIPGMIKIPDRDKSASEGEQVSIFNRGKKNDPIVNVDPKRQIDEEDDDSSFEEEGDEDMTDSENREDDRRSIQQPSAGKTTVTQEKEVVPTRKPFVTKKRAIIAGCVVVGALAIYGGYRYIKKNGIIIV